MKSSAADPGRRRLLGLAAGATVLAALPAAAADPAAGDRGLALRLVGLLAEPADAAELGRRYLRSAAQEGSVSRLVSAIAGTDEGDRPGRERLASLDGVTLRTEVAARIRADFASRRLVRLDGWVLSVTEARLTALAALVYGAAV
jgi:hypothetical protein